MRSQLGRAAVQTLRRSFEGAVLMALAACLLVVPSAATAAPTAVSAYSHLADFGESDVFNSGSPAPGGIAVDPATGNILVADEYFGDVKVFAPDASLGGTLLTTFTTGTPRSIAIDPATGAVYAVDAFQGTFTRWLSDGAPVPTYTVDPAFTAALTTYEGGIAVDPATHDLLVTEPNQGRVTRFSSAGAALSSFDGSDVPSGKLMNPTGVAVGLDGSVYVVDQPARVERFSAAGAWLESLPVQGSPVNVTVDPASGRIVVNDGGLEAFDAGGDLLYRIGTTPDLEASAQRGLAIDGSSERLYTYTHGTVTGVHAFDPAILPGVEPPVVSALTPTSARLSAMVDPGAGPPAESSAHFEYSADNGATWSSTPDQDDSSGHVEADLTGLEPNLEYLVRIVAKNSLLQNVSAATTFNTVAIPPTVNTGFATDATATSSVLNGTIDPVGLQTTYHFEWGPTVAYGNRVPLSIEAVAGNGRADRLFSRTIKGLQPGATYHFRIVAQNAAGVSEGADRTFTTLPAGAIAQRGYEQVSSVDKLGAVVDNRVGYLAKADGSAFSYISRPAGAETESAPWMTRSISRRGTADWNSGIPIDPPLGVQRSYTMQTTLAISADFTHTFVITDRKLTPDGVEGSTNLYVRDLGTGSYTLVATTPDPEAFQHFASLQTANKFVAGAPDFSWLVFGAVRPLLPGVNGTALYRWSAADGLKLESVLSNDEIPTAEVHLSPPAGGQRQVSDDGTRTYFTLTGGSEEGVYLREDGETRPISVSHLPAEPGQLAAGMFLATSADGRYAFFFSQNAQLTADAPGDPGDVYRYDAIEDELDYVGTQAGPGGTPTDRAPLGISEDGRTIYFSGPDGMYVWREGALTKISDPFLGLGQGFVSPNGDYFAYEFGDVYLYDLQAGALACASCLADGSSGGGSLPDSERFINNRTPQVVDDQGRLFFDTPARLVAADVNGERDVYQFQDGRATLISPGNAPFEARFADMSKDGNDVFFTTNQKLVGQDNDQSPDVYDARIAGGLASQNRRPRKSASATTARRPPTPDRNCPSAAPKLIKGSGNVKPRKPRRIAGRDGTSAK